MSTAKLDLEVLPRVVYGVAGTLLAQGGRCWLVGGPVRDLLLGRQPVDFDLATDLRPEIVAACLPDADSRDRGYGACRLETPVGPIVVTTLRKETGYGDHRHPDRVEFVTDPAVDATRRDFTINAIYVDLADGAVVDPTGGGDDLRAGLLRAIGDPHQRFREDALRLLRLLRFHARYGFAIEPATRTAAQQSAALLPVLSAERVYAELTAAFVGPGRGDALRALVELGFAAVLLPEVAAMAGVTQPPEYHPEGDVLTHVALVLDHVPPDDPVLAWSAVLHDIGKPPTWRQAADRIRFDGHDQLSATMADAVLRRLHAPAALREAVVEVCRDHIRFAALPGMRPRRREQWMRNPRFAQHLAFHRADCLGSHGNLAIHDLAQQLLRELPPEAPRLLSGADVLALGVAPGPLVGELLRRVDELLEERSLPGTRDEALVLLRDLVQPLRKEADPPGR